MRTARPRASARTRLTAISNRDCRRRRRRDPNDRAWTVVVERGRQTEPVRSPRRVGDPVYRSTVLFRGERRPPGCATASAESVPSVRPETSVYRPSCRQYGSSARRIANRGPEAVPLLGESWHGSVPARSFQAYGLPRSGVRNISDRTEKRDLAPATRRCRFVRPQTETTDPDRATVSVADRTRRLSDGVRNPCTNP